MDIVVMVGQLLLSLTFLVAIHEWGHMFAAKRFGIWVETFSIFFFPKLFGFKFSKDKHATEYCLGLLPLGGFVKIAGMMDESMDKDQLAQEPQPWEFRTKPAWQRLIVMLGGIIVNTVAGITIFILSFFYYGETYIPMSELKQGIGVGQVGIKMGLQDGDQIIAVNGVKPVAFSDLISHEVLLADDMYYTVKRGEKEFRVDVPKDILNQIDAGKKLNALFSPYLPFLVDTIIAGKNAEKAGLKMGDKILKINKVDALHFDRFTREVQDNKEKEVTLLVSRNGKNVTIKCMVDDDGHIGFHAKQIVEYKPKTRFYSFMESIPRGTEEGFSVFSSNILAIKKMIKGEADPSKTLNSPIAMASAYGTTWKWERFWKLTGLISLALAFMNLLPIPALDGGHVVILLYEMISGKKPSDKFLENTQKVGAIILLTLMALLFGKDIWALIVG